MSQNIFDCVKDIDEKNLPIVSHDKLESLPVPIQKYIKFAVKDGTPVAYSCRFKREEGFKHGGRIKIKLDGFKHGGRIKIKLDGFKHGGRIKIKLDSKFTNFSGKEYMTFMNKPQFHWDGFVSYIPFIFWMNIVDSFVDLKGNLKVKLDSIITVVNEKGDEITEAQAARYFAECTLNPSSFYPGVQDEWLSWEEIDDYSCYGLFMIPGTDKTIKGKFVVDENGELQSFECYRMCSATNSKELWFCELKEYKSTDYHGMKYPSDIKLSYKMKDMDYHVIDYPISDMEYNAKKTY